MENINNKDNTQVNIPQPLGTPQRVINIIIDKSGLEPDMVKPDSELHDLSFDSLDVIELVMEFEKEFGIAIPDYEIEKIATVRDSINLIEKKISAK